jgi:hypothetical protein
LRHDDDGAEFSDWRTPSYNELLLMLAIKNSGNGPAFNNYDYWSSIEYIDDKAYFMNFGTGSWSNIDKTMTLALRAVRVF